MTAEQFARERDYSAAISIARFMLRRGLITEREYCKADALLGRKYRPIIGGLQTKIA
jgi:hypothetical protein